MRDYESIKRTGSIAPFVLPTEQELREQHQQQLAPQPGHGVNDNVCFLVRSSYVHSQDRNISLLDRDYFSGFDNIIQCKRQTVRADRLRPIAGP